MQEQRVLMGDSLFPAYRVLSISQSALARPLKAPPASQGCGEKRVGRRVFWAPEWPRFIVP